MHPFSTVYKSKNLSKTVRRPITCTENFLSSCSLHYGTPDTDRVFCKKNTGI